MPRRARCRGCGRTHVLLGAYGLLRRRDAVWSIGFALVAKAAGHGFRWSAGRLGVPVSTVRGWLRRFATQAEGVRVWFTVLAHDLDPLLPRIDPAGSPFGDAVEAVGMAARAAEKRLGSGAGWGFVSRASAGKILANTGCPWEATG
ncbi:MAG: helix-turn-helix domain-containing protein [Candidatus Microthrix sp.]|nr:helix-turn-helix domain-containing protein [Candidatus Microthrix sp.]